MKLSRTAQHSWHSSPFYFIIYVIASLLRTVLFLMHSPFVVGILLPVPVIVAAFAQDSLPFTMVRFPPIACLARDQSLNYFSLNFPLNIIMMVGFSLLLPVIWTVHKVYDIAISQYVLWASHFVVYTRVESLVENWWRTVSFTCLEVLATFAIN